MLKGWEVSGIKGAVEHGVTKLPNLDPFDDIDPTLEEDCNDIPVIDSSAILRAVLYIPTQRTQTPLRRLQGVLKRSRRLATKQDIVTTSGKRRRIYDVLKTSDLRHLEDVQFRTS